MFKRNKRIISFPYIGREYTKIIKRNLESLGLNIQLPPNTTDKTIKLGVQNSSLMMCFPYKVTLGNFIEALDNGANVLLMYDSLGQCRLKHYHKIQEFTLKNLAYKDFELYGINRNNALKLMKKFSGKSYYQVIKTLINLIKDIREHDKKRIWSKEKPNIGIIGEIFSCCDEIVNYHLEKKIKKFGANPYNTVTISDFLNYNFLPIINKKDKYKKKAESYFNGEVGGHIVENVSNLLELIDNGADGVIHVLPLSCAPEVIGEPVINQICKESEMSLLRIPIDENFAEANLETRLETFCEVIRMRKNAN